MTTKIGAFLKDARTKKKYTAKEVAQKINISATYYSEIERGTRFPSKDIFIRLSTILSFIVPKALDCVKEDLFQKWGK